MLAIRMQRTGRRGHAMFRVIVQDARRTPTSGKVVARLGSYDPHAKTIVLDKEKAAFYLDHGAQPSDRVARLLKDEGVKLPGWVKQAAKKESTVRNPDKRRSTRPPESEAPAEPAPEAAAEKPAEAPDEKPETASETVEEPAAEATPAGTADEQPAEAPSEETPAAEANTEPAAEATPAEAPDDASEKADKPAEA